MDGFFSSKWIKMASNSDSILLQASKIDVQDLFSGGDPHLQGWYIQGLLPNGWGICKGDAFANSSHYKLPR